MKQNKYKLALDEIARSRGIDPTEIRKETQLEIDAYERRQQLRSVYWGPRDRTIAGGDPSL